MTDKVQKIREEVEKRFEQIKNSEKESDSGAFYQLKELLEFIDSLQEEPVSEDLEEYSALIADELPQGTTLTSNGEFDIASVRKLIIDACKHGAKWQKEQFEKNRLDACDKQTEEEAEIESDFVMGIIEKEHRQPTFDDAIKYGMKLKEQQMMSNAIDAHCFGFQGDALFSFRLPADNYLVGSEVKVIVIKKK